jgi:hypothetical protein
MHAGFCGEAIRGLGCTQTPSSRASVGVHPRRRRRHSGIPLPGLDSAPSRVQIGRHRDAERACLAATVDPSAALIQFASGIVSPDVV